MRSASQIMEALDSASKGVQAASTELSELSQGFHEAKVDSETGEVKELGIGLQFDIAIKDELATIYNDAIQAEPPRRPPAEDIREAMAHRAVQVKRPELWASYHTTKARIDALKSWISNQKSAISANQSILRGERA